MARKIKDLQQRFDGIAELKNKFHLTERHESTRHDRRPDRETHSFVQASEVIGRDQEKQRIVNKLTRDDVAAADEEDIPVLPIVGIGGIRHVYLLNSDSSKGSASEFLKKLGHARTLRFPYMGNGPTQKSFLETCLRRFQHLRMLDVFGSTFEVLPEWIGDLKHLGISTFVTVATSRKSPTPSLPKDMRYMTSLRCLSLTTKQRDLNGHGLEHLKSLQFLIIWGCENLEHLFEGIHKLTFLHTLGVANCRNLVSLPHGLNRLTALKTLVIGICGKLDLSTTHGSQEKEDDDDNQGFNLQSLETTDLPKLEALPHWLLRRSANSLRNVTIKHCENLTASSEWHNLTSLEKVEIAGCPRLSSLPKTMQRLKQLHIGGCPILSERCRQEIGVDWPKIAHASLIVLDGHKISVEDD
ncbi:hypothetical protein V6N13_063544 [Hibiscus sabdariffa]